MPNPCFAFLLRMWKPNDPDASDWQASLEDPHTP
jgi:hypothetical protein